MRPRRSGCQGPGEAVAGPAVRKPREMLHPRAVGGREELQELGAVEAWGVPTLLGWGWRKGRGVHGVVSPPLGPRAESKCRALGSNV